MKTCLQKSTMYYVMVMALTPSTSNRQVCDLVVRNLAGPVSCFDHHNRTSSNRNHTSTNNAENATGLTFITLLFQYLINMKREPV